MKCHGGANSSGTESSWLRENKSLGPSVHGLSYYCFPELGAIHEKDDLIEEWLFLQAQKDLSLRHAL